MAKAAKVIDEGDEGKRVTYDLTPTAVGTSEFGNAVIEAMREL